MPPGSRWIPPASRATRTSSAGWTWSSPPAAASATSRSTPASSTRRREGNSAPGFLNERLMSDLRPTLFLAQLSNLLAGNIAIVHGVCGTSRTFMGEEVAGVDATRIALARIAAGQSDIALIGGSHNGERKDLLVLYEFGDFNLRDKLRAGLGAQGAFRLRARLGRGIPRHRVQGACDRARRKTLCAPDERGGRSQPAQAAGRRHRDAAKSSGRRSASPRAAAPSSPARPAPSLRPRRSAPSSPSIRNSRARDRHAVRPHDGDPVCAGTWRLRRCRCRAAPCFRPAIPRAWRLKCRSRRPRLWWSGPGTGGAKAWPWSRRSGSQDAGKRDARRTRRRLATGGEQHDSTTR